MRVFKYPLQSVERQMVWLPTGSEILSVQMQGEQLQLWALVDERLSEKWATEIVIVGTGHPVPEVKEFINTFQMSGGALVFHVFEGV